MTPWALLVCLLPLANGYSEQTPLHIKVTDVGIKEDWAWEALQHLEQATNYIYARAFAEDQVSLDPLQHLILLVYLY